MSAPIFALPAVLTHEQAQATAQALVTAVHANPHLTLDAGALRQFDSSALAVLLAGLRAASAQDGRITVQGLPSRAASLARVYGLADVLQAPTDSA